MRRNVGRRHASAVVRAIGLTGLVALSASGCVWVALDEEAEVVRLFGEGDDVAACTVERRIGAHTKAGVGIFDRRPQDIALELDRIARNRARELGGNAVIPVGPIDEKGSREYDMLVCPDAAP